MYLQIKPIDPTEGIIKNGAFRLLTDIYNKSSDMRDIVWLNEQYSKKQVFALAAIQGM